MTTEQRMAFMVNLHQEDTRIDTLLSHQASRVDYVG